MIFPSTPKPETSNVQKNSSFDFKTTSGELYTTYIYIYIYIYMDTSNLFDFCMCPCSIESFLFSGQAQPLCQAVECCSRGRSWIEGWKHGWHRRMLLQIYTIWRFRCNKIKCGRDFWQFQLKFDAAQLFLSAGSWSAKQGLKPAYLCLSN